MRERKGICNKVELFMPTPQAYLAVHLCAELAKALKIHKINEIKRVNKERAERIAAMRIAK